MNALLTITCTDKQEMDQLLESPTLIAVIDTYLNEMRSVWKHGDREPTDTVTEAEKWSKRLYEIIADYEVRHLIT